MVRKWIDGYLSKDGREEAPDGRFSTPQKCSRSNAIVCQCT